MNHTREAAPKCRKKWSLLALCSYVIVLRSSNRNHTIMRTRKASVNHPGQVWYSSMSSMTSTSIYSKKESWCCSAKKAFPVHIHTSAGKKSSHCLAYCANFTLSLSGDTTYITKQLNLWNLVPPESPTCRWLWRKNLQESLSIQALFAASNLLPSFITLISVLLSPHFPRYAWCSPAWHTYCTWQIKRKTIIFYQLVLTKKRKGQCLY